MLMCDWLEEPTDTTDGRLSVMDDKTPYSANERFFFCLVGAGITALALLLISASMTITKGLVALLVLGLILLGMGVCGGSVRNAGDIEYVGPTDETCPACGAKGTIEVYKSKSEEHEYMVNCKNIHCSYRKSYASHSKERNERTRTQLTETLAESYRKEALASSKRNEDVPADAESSLTPEERASSAIKALEEEAGHDELRREYNRHRRTMINHPESERLKAEGFGSCPECANPVIFVRWGVRWGNKSVAVCSKNCGYLSLLKRHKKACQDASSLDVDSEQGRPSYELRSLLD